MDTLISILGSCLPCFPDLSSPYVTIKNVKYRIIKLLGEGGFSYVYLVKSSVNDAQYAMKKIRCPFGSNDETYKNSIKEIKNYHRFLKFGTPYIIQSIEEIIISEVDGSKTVYILLPYFEKSLQDIINNLVMNDDKMPEEDILKIFIGICRGLKVMHNYKTTTSQSAQSVPNSIADDVHSSTSADEDGLLLPPQGPASDDEDEENGDAPPSIPTELSQLIPFAHRDIKPANVMISAEGLPVLVDLGSCSKARIKIRNRQQALTLQDFAQEHCTLPYRAPELLDVVKNSEVTEKTDIWSLGCLLYACCFGYSPFEKLELEQGANISLAISQGKYIMPKNNGGYSSELMDIINQCLKLNPDKRPTVDQLLETTIELSRNSDL
ncbi:kinase-like domain-containing protein [Scheffersomyces coipomensis]|uniref:kinase-like domain-containing protein n=1 Tax=Scheffersomyces coipomensis TaxID=1788519 RepID=UPI00315D9713